MAKFLIPVCLLFLALVHTGYSLKCYACDSKNKVDCGDPFMKEKIPYNECPTPSQPNQEASCLKLITDEKIKRYCFNYPKGVKPCEYVASQNKNLNIKECIDCTEDGCNAAGGISAPTYVLVATCIMAMVNMFARS